MCSDASFQLDQLIRRCTPLLEQLGVGVLIADHNCVVRYVNPRYSAITGAQIDAIIGRPVQEVRPNDQFPIALKKNLPIYSGTTWDGSREYIIANYPLFINKRFSGGLCLVIDSTKFRRSALKSNRSIPQLRRIKGRVNESFSSRYTFKDILGRSESIAHTKKLAFKMAQSDSNVLITGESGTGKEMFTHAIHSASLRSGNPLVPVNCAAISPTLLESELFGYSEGAFTGARKGGKIGLVELADRGTLFLDEISDINIQQQAKLLRVLEEQRYMKVGGTSEKTIDIRVIACTNKDLETLALKNQFREDLFYRLSALQLHIPPLRERVEDIMILAKSFLGKISQASKKTISISDQACEYLRRYHYPGNVRELKHVIEYSSLMSSDTITPDNLPGKIVQGHRKSCDDDSEISPLKKSVRAYEARIINDALRKFGNTLEGKKRASQSLGISLATLYSKLN